MTDKKTIIDNLSLLKIHEKLSSELNNILKLPVDSYKKNQLEDIFQKVEDIGFVKGLAMALFDSPSNIVKIIKKLEN